MSSSELSGFQHVAMFYVCVFVFYGFSMWRFGVKNRSNI